MRRFPKKAALTGSALFLLFSSGNIENPINPTSAHEPTPASAPAKLSPEQNYILVGGPNKLFLNQEGLPLKYATEDGKEIFFDIGEMRNAKAQAISSGEPEVAALITDHSKSIQHDGYNMHSIEHPEVPDLPDDVLSEKELNNKGVGIVQADNTNFYIREGAFAKGGPLEAFNSTGRKLTIVLVNAPVLSEYLLDDPKYTEFIKFLPEEVRKKESIDEYRARKINSLKDELNLSRIKKQAESSGSNNTILDIKYALRQYKDMTNEEILLEMALDSTNIEGKYSPILIETVSQSSGSEITRKRSVDNSVIFIAVGGSKIGQNNKVVYFTPDGKLRSFTSSGAGYNKDNSPNQIQTHPNPKRFTILSGGPTNSRSYVYGGVTAGQRARHEFGHDKLVAQEFLKGNEPDYSEYNADVIAMEGIESACETWEKSGFTDNSGFHFVFSLPPEQGGGYILTKNRQSNPNTPSGS